ncbi:MAG: rod shape-determining protein MreD [Bacteroidota bacterium]|nr:rod shape-determining protein MreD [Bacteroidota bacterium]MDP4190865.1 rod shape-determining protein MreD [Bacteroidota bacterium]MDP4193902.1 rod shape-determining protein MreD [Bacteroidota bacterium]
MRSDYIFAVLLFIPLAVIQLTLVPWLSYNQVGPDLILILLVFYTLRVGQLGGTILGFIFGLAFDLISGTILGSAMFTKTLSGFLTGYFYNENKVEQNIHSLSLLLIVFLIGTVDSIIYSFFGNTNTGSTSILIMFFMQGLLPGLYSSVLALPLVVFYTKKMFA